MPLIQTLFYFAGFISFALAALFFLVIMMLALRANKRAHELADTIEDKMNTSLGTALLPFLPTLIALFGEFKSYRKKRR